MALFLGATVEYGHGSVWLGILLLAAAIYCLTRVRFGEVEPAMGQKWAAAAGVFVIISDVFYNYHTLGSLGVLDTMTFVLGASLIAFSLKRDDVRRMGVFGIYVSAVFIVLFLFFYVLLDRVLGIPFIHYFDTYFVMIPSVYLVKMLGIPIEVVGVELVSISGVDGSSTVKIGGPCSGLYSMFLLIGIVVGFGAADRMSDIKKIRGIMLIAIVAAWLSNLVRVSVLYVVGSLYGMDIMMTVHTHLGWVIFAGMASLIMVMLSKVDV